MDVEKIKKDFPQFKTDESLVYLDTAASSLTPYPVLEAVQEYYECYRANAHRGLYRSAQRATKAFEETRKTIAEYIGAKTEEVIFTGGATVASNMLAHSLEHTISYTKDDEIVTTVMEHHALLLPLQQLAKRNGMKVRHVELDGMFLSNHDVAKHITKKTKIVGVTLASNVLGTINDIKAIVTKAHEVDALVVVDATAAVGHMPVDVKSLGADFLFFSGHKMCGPTGVGVLYGKHRLLQNIEPSIVGGGIVETVTREDVVWQDGPTRFESGTQNIAGVIGLGVAVEYLSSIGLEHIHAHARALVAYAEKELSKIEGVSIYSANTENNIGILSFTLDCAHPHDVAEIAGRHNVALRAGHHCAMPLHTELGVPATVRASFYIYNTKKDVDALAESIVEARKIFTTNA